MEGLLADQPRVSDLRGTAPAPSSPAVLEDPSGRRRRRLRLAARAVAVVLTLWLLALVLGSIGLNPVTGIPFSKVLRPVSPPTPASLPAPKQPSKADLKPARPAPGHTRSGTLLATTHS